MFTPTRSDVLLIVDPQNDFCPGGSLGIPDGDAIFEQINRFMPRFRHVLATQDWHPPDHSSFTSHGGPHAIHCVAETHGAAFHPRLDTSLIKEVVRKGLNRETLGYSGFEGTDLAARLRDLGVERLVVCGMATTGCVKATVLDALEAGFRTLVVTDAVAARDAVAAQQALSQMAAAGAELIASAEVEGGAAARAEGCRSEF